MDFDNIITLIKAVSDSSLTNFTLEDKEFKISMKTDKGNKIIATAKDAGQIVYSSPIYSSPINTADVMAQNITMNSNQEIQYSGNVIKSPLVGTFYSAPDADQPPYVAVGDTVKKGQVLGIVEAMKLMNEIECECDGIVKEILIENEKIVEYGQPLFVIGE